MKELLEKYLDQTIGLNYNDPKKFKEAKLLKVTDEYFSVFANELFMTIHYPYGSILYLAEAEGGIKTGLIFGNTFQLVIEVNHLIVYQGAVGVSF